MNEKSAHYYLLAIANFLAALGGGTILGKGIGIINSPYIHGSAILSFFVGSVLGLVFLQSIPKNWAKIVGYSFSALCGISSLILLFIFNSYAVDGKITDIAGLMFFVLLCVRFGFWFYSRVLRASAAAGLQQRIAWVEFGYYTGMIAGLIAWKVINIDIAMSAALIIDVILQFCAGSLDIVANIKANQKTVSNPIEEAQKPTREIKSNQDEKIWGWKLSISVVLLTIGIQATVFNLTHYVSAYFSSFILAFFYLGVSLAAVFCRTFTISLEWNSYNQPVICTSKNPKEFSLLSNLILTTIITTMTFLGAISWNWATDSFSFTTILFFLLVTLSAFMYEVIALAILDRIGLEERATNQKGMVIRAYGLIGVGASIGLWILGMSTNTMIGLMLMLYLCVISSAAMISKRASLAPEIQI